MKRKNAYLFGFIFLIISVVFTVLTKFVDVGISAEVPDTQIGFSAINNGFHKLTGVNMLFYDITDIMGIIAIGVGLIFALVGLIELIKRKSLAKIDGYLYCLAGTYALLGIIYVGFEKVIINYRPIIMEGETTAEASFPSSHTLLICVIIATAIIQLNRIFADNKAIKTTVYIVGSLYILVAVLLRLLSGVHWLTDIVASIFISCSICFFYYGLSLKKGKHSL